MTTVNATVSPALERALDLLTDPPGEPDASKGYLDLLGSSAADDEGPAKNTGPIQAMWASSIGSMLYDNAQALSRRFFAALQHPIEWLNIPQGGVALDVGSGPGSITASLARAAGPDGLALGVDISEPMLARAVRAEAGPQVGFLRADAQRLPLRDETVDAVVSIAVLQLIPDPFGGAGRDRPGAATGRTTGGDGADSPGSPAALAQAAQRRGLCVRRRRNRRHPGRPRLRQRADQDHRHVPVGAGQTGLITPDGWFSRTPRYMPHRTIHGITTRSTDHDGKRNA